MTPEREKELRDRMAFEYEDGSRPADADDLAALFDEIDRLRGEAKELNEALGLTERQVSDIEFSRDVFLEAGAALAAAYRNLGGLEVAHDPALAAWDRLARALPEKPGVKRTDAAAKAANQSWE